MIKNWLKSERFGEFIADSLLRIVASRAIFIERLEAQFK
jgi:hypothetical protein